MRPYMGSSFVKLVAKQCWVASGLQVVRVPLGFPRVESVFLLFGLANFAR